MNAVFFDLQGTLGGTGLDDVRTFSFFPFAPEALRLVRDAGRLAIVITNQAHIADGLFTPDDFHARMADLAHELKAEGTQWDGVYMCPHRDDHQCGCRKPKPGMLLQAAGDFGLDLPSCVVVGDAGAWDIQLARAVGAKGVLVRTGLGESSLGEYRYTWGDTDADFVASNVLEAARWIVDQ